MSIQQWREFVRFGEANPHLTLTEAVEIFYVLQDTPIH